MATFSEKFLEFKDTRNFNQIPVTCIEEQWLITIGKNSVIKVQDSKSLHTWTLPQGHTDYFTTPVAFFKEELYSVTNGNVLLKWSVEDINLKRAETIKLQEDVHSIIHLQGSEPLIIFQTGKFAIVDASTFSHPKPLESIQLKDGYCLEWVDATLSATNIEVFYLTFNNKLRQRILYYFSVSKECKTVSPPCTFNISHKNAAFKACCLNHQDLSFFSLWSDGTVQCYNVKDSQNDKVMMSLEDISVDTIIDVCCIDSKHIVTAKGRPKDKECLLEIWDVKQAILKGSRKVETPELLSLQISATSDHIFLNLVSDKLIAIQYHMDSSFVSTLNTSEPQEFQQLSWDTNLEVKPVLTENEPMDIYSDDQSSADSVELLAEKLLNQDSFDLKFISESELIKMLKLLIRHQKDNNQNDFNKDIYNLLNIIFSASFNDALLMIHIKILNIEDILVILYFLLKYLKNSMNLPVDVQEKPTDLQIVNWICLVITTHTETLLFTKDKTAKKLLKDLKKTLVIKMKELEDLEGLQNYLSLLQIKDIFPQQYSTEKYSLESLDV